MIWSDSIDIKLPNGKSKLVSIKELESYNKELIEKIKPEVTYSASDETILKKYAEQPKTIKKLFGVEPKIVKDAKGNSWYEFDIPKSFKEGKGEIKAFENGGKLTTAQNGQEMRFYQNGLDWKPRSMREGGITKDNQGYWNPDNWGKPVEIDSNDITMEGVYEPLLGVSDTGDTKLMQPGKNYKFKGKKVTEFPVAKLGINQLDAQPMKKLNQLLNFTNNPDKDNGLDKYN